MLDVAQVSTALRGYAIGREMNFRPRVESTQDIVREAASQGAAEGFISLADLQTIGRGRLGRSWVSPAGTGLHLSVLLRPDLATLRGLSMIAPLAACHAIESVTEVRTGIKWPNDIFVSGRKLGGVLIETEFSGDVPQYSIVGIGLNINLVVSEVEEIRDTATSLFDQTGHQVSREAVLIVLLQELDNLYQGLRTGASPFPEWKARLVTLGQQVTARIGDRVEHGFAEDVRDDGALIVLREDGSRAIVEAGDVTLRG